jgi:hypothetical protein
MNGSGFASAPKFFLDDGVEPIVPERAHVDALRDEARFPEHVGDTGAAPSLPP